jgi:hypothetical protein
VIRRSSGFSASSGWYRSEAGYNSRPSSIRWTPGTKRDDEQCQSHLEPASFPSRGSPGSQPDTPAGVSRYPIGSPTVDSTLANPSGFQRVSSPTPQPVEPHATAADPPQPVDAALYLARARGGSRDPDGRLLEPQHRDFVSATVRSEAALDLRSQSTSLDPAKQRAVATRSSHGRLFPARGTTGFWRIRRPPLTWALYRRLAQHAARVCRVPVSFGTFDDSYRSTNQDPDGPRWLSDRLRCGSGST